MNTGKKLVQGCYVVKKSMPIRSYRQWIIASVINILHLEHVQFIIIIIIIMVHNTQLYTLFCTQGTQIKCDKTMKCKTIQKPKN